MRTGRWFRNPVGSAAAVLLSCGILVSGVFAAAIDPYYAGSYSLIDLGSAPDVVENYGGLTLLAGTTDTLLIGGSANTADGSLYTIRVSRDAQGHINGFVGSATLYGSAPYNDGGVTYGPDGVLCASQWPVNRLSQYRPGSSSPDKVTDLAALGAAASNAAINFVPAGFGGAGQMKLVSYGGGEFYTADYSPDGLGTFDISAVTSEGISLPGGPEGFVYVAAGSPLFDKNSMLVSECRAGKVGAYELDANGNPILATRRDFLTDLSGTQGAFIDPLTGDFLFSTFGGESRIIAVRGFAVTTTGVPEQ